MAKESGKTVVRRVKAADNAESVSKKTDQNTTKSAKTSGPKNKAVSSVKPAVAKKTAPTKAKPVADSDAKPFVLFRPIFATGRYFRDSWRELRQVRWTNRRSTWAMTLAVLLFSLFFVLFILLCDWIFNFVIEEVIL